MRQSIINHMKDQLSKFSYAGPKELPGSGIPQDYEPIWFEFLNSRVYKDLVVDAQNPVHKDYLTVIGFVSYISTFDDLGYDFVGDAVKQVTSDMANTVKRIKDIIRRFRLIQHLKPCKMIHDIQFTTSDMMNMALVLHLEGFVWLQPTQKKHSLTAILQSLKGSLYKKNLPLKLSKEECTSSERLMNNPTLFEQVYKDKTIKLNLARVRGSMLLLKYDIDIDYSLFYGNQFKQFDQTLGDLWPKLLNLG